MRYRNDIAFVVDIDFLYNVLISFRSKVELNNITRDKML